MKKCIVDVDLLKRPSVRYTLGMYKLDRRGFNYQAECLRVVNSFLLKKPLSDELGLDAALGIVFGAKKPPTTNNVRRRAREN